MTLQIKFAKTGTLTAAKYLYGVLTSPHRATVSAYLGTSGAWRFGTGYTAISTNDGADHVVEVKNTSSKAQVTFDSTVKTFTKATFTTTRPLLVGGYENASGSRYKSFVGKIYYFRILKGEDVLLDWTPMVRKSDGVEGFYDNVSKTFIERI